VTTPIIFDSSDDYSSGNEVSYVEQKRDMWASSTIRKTTLKSGFRIEGKMFFPRFEKSGTYLFKVPVDDLEIEIPFMQIIYNPAFED
jgi:transcription termination factor Rho